jgi:multiple sugar transport system substrate-binding protein
MGDPGAQGGEFPWSLPLSGRALLTAVIIALALFSGCGGSSSGGTPTLNWFVATQPGGTIQEVAKRCTDESHGRYKVNVELLPTDASQQREQLVRRLAAKDSTVDLVGMDVIWTAEFANAGWIKEFPASLRSQVTKKVFPSVIKTASFEGRLYGSPFNSNTQLLWYRKDLVPKPPTTWDQMISEAEKLKSEGKPGTIQVQANKYEGFTVWATAMIESAGAQILSGPESVALPEGPTDKALKVMGTLAHSSAAATNISTSTEDTARLGFESGDSAFMLNYTFAYASAGDNAPDIQKVMGFARYPEVVPGKPSRPPLGGFNIGVGAYTNHPTEAFQAAACLSNRKSQLTATELDGLPPSRQDLYKSKTVLKAFPGFAPLVEESINAAAPRPQSPAYQDVSLGIQDAIQPPSKIDPNNPSSAYDQLHSNLEDAVQRKGLL